MSDIKLPDNPGTLIREEAFVATPVTMNTLTKMADLCNWLNFYAKRVSPYVRYSPDTSTKIDAIPFPVGGAYGLTRKIIVKIGVRQVDEETEPTINVSTTAIGGMTVSWTQQPLAINPGGISFTTLANVTSSEVGIKYFVFSMGVDGGGVELIEINSDADLDGVGIWELPQGVSDSSVFGGGLFSASHVDSTANYALSPVDFYDGKSILASDVSSIVDSMYAAHSTHGRIFFKFTDSDWYASDTSTDLPVGGIRLPKSHWKGVNEDSSGNKIVKVRALVKANIADGTATIALKSEGLSTTGSSHTWTTTGTLWQPEGSIANTTWNSTTCTVLECDALADGDWIYLVASIEGSEGSLHITDGIFWLGGNESG